MAHFPASAIAHFAKAANVSFNEQALLNAWPSLQAIFVNPNIVRVCKYIQCSAGVGRKSFSCLIRFWSTDCFDGELDDKVRLEGILYGSSLMSPIIVIVGQRVDGSYPVADIQALINAVRITRATLPDIKVIQGGPLKKSNLVHRGVLARLVELLNGRAYVFHNNTSATLLYVLLSSGKLVRSLQVREVCCGAVPRN